jgi:3',5'-cyclic-nucleotide phosphodiesterase
MEALTLRRLGMLAAGIALAAPLLALPALAGGGFDVVALGARGGIEDGNLSAWLIKPHDDDRYVACDAGSLVNGLRVADERGVFDSVKVPADSPYGRVGFVLTSKIKGYLISHAHLDHVAGMVAASPDDSAKPIYGLPSVADELTRDYFNWETWPNFSFEGRWPYIKKYEYRRLQPGTEEGLSDTEMTVTPYPLNHGGIESTAFLLRSGGDALACFGDTGADPVQKVTKLHEAWVAIAPMVQAHKLRAIIIEASYPDSVPDEALFGHLKPKYLIATLHDLASLAGGPDALKGLPIVIEHIKYSLKKGPTQQEEIAKELAAANDLGVKFIIPEQGDAWSF